MPNILESLSMCAWFDVNAISRRNLVSAFISGVFFFLAWWLVLDCSSVYPKSLHFSHYICGILATISFIMVNSVNNAMLNGTGYSDGCMGTNGVKVWLFTGFVLGFSALIASVWLMISEFTQDLSPSDTPKEGGSWPGIVLLLQNALILVSSLLYKFGRTDEASFAGF